METEKGQHDPNEIQQNETRQEKSRVQQEPEYNTDFMREEIRQRPVNKKRLLRRTLFTAFLAVLFGVIACTVFLVLEPVINRAMNPTEEPAPVTFSEEATEEEMNPEDMIASDEQIQEQAAEEKAASSVDEIKQAVLEEVEKELALREEQDGGGTDQTEETRGDSWESLQETADRVQKSMVTVTSVTPDYDWAGDAFDSTGSGSGLIIAEKGTDILILANDDDYEDAGEIRVTFHDGEQAPAEIVCIDNVTDLVILAVSGSDLETPFPENDAVAICTLGSSARTDLPGKRVIAVGSPAGSQGSLSYGFITNSGLTLDVVDSSFTRMTTDIYGSTLATGALADADGEIIGWINMNYNGTDSRNLISAVGITGMKPLIERMSNEVHAGYLGVHAADVPDEIARAQNIPDGAYVIRTEMDSPAMEAGIQSGDLITDVGGSRISSGEVLMNILGQSREGRQLTITVMRGSQNVYHEMELAVSLTERFTFPGKQ